MSTDEDAEIQMRAEHVSARQDHADWLRELAAWRVDHRKAQAILARVSATFFDMDADLEAHASAIRAHQFEIKVHERALGRETDAGVAELHAQRHRELEQTHDDVGVGHDALRAKHNEMMNDLGALMNALSYQSQLD